MNQKVESAKTDSRAEISRSRCHHSAWHFAARLFDRANNHEKNVPDWRYWLLGLAKVTSWENERPRQSYKLRKRKTKAVEKLVSSFFRCAGTVLIVKWLSWAGKAGVTELGLLGQLPGRSPAIIQMGITFTEIHEYSWIFMDIHRFWISMDIHGYPWKFIDFHGYQ